MVVPYRKPKVFISATSRDLKSFRKVVADWAAESGYDVVVQDEFPVMSDYQTIVQMLREKLDPCDAVIHLAGFFYGFEPTIHPDGEARRSYTQLEYELGKEHKRQVFRFIAAEGYAADRSLAQIEQELLTEIPGFTAAQFAEQSVLQREHRERLMHGSEPYSPTSRTTGNELYYVFSNHAELRDFLKSIEIKSTLLKPNNLPSVGSLFKGRDDFLEQLRSVLLDKPTHIAAVTAKQTIHGLGGVGKTRVAVEYAKRYSHEYTALLFITGDSSSNLHSNLANLCGAMVLNLPEQAAREQEVQVAAAIRWLREHAGWFLIVDNVDTPEAATAAEELLQKLDTGHVVITSRLSQWGHAVQELALDVLSESAAVEMLLERTAGKRKPSLSDAADTLALAKDLGCLPLALEQAGAFIVEDGCSFADYRKLWKAHDDEVLNWHDQRTMKYPRSVATTWQTSFDKLGDNGRSLLRILCWLAPEPIPLTMLEKLPTGEGEMGINISKARRDLARYSLAKWSDGTNTAIVVHRLVQEITEYRLPQDEKLPWLKRSLQMVNQFCVSDPFDVRSWKDVYVLARPHLFAITATADQANIADPTNQLMNKLATYLYKRSEWDEAESLMRRALAIDEANFGKDDPNVAIHLNNLAQLLQTTNRLAEAEQMMRRVLTIYEASSDEWDSYVAVALNSLAHLLAYTGRLVEAEPMYRRSLAIDEVIYGPDHPNVAKRLNNLSSLLWTTERLAEAEPLMRRALAINEASFRFDHPNVATNLNNLAKLLQYTNRLTEAERMYRRALDIDEASYGPNNPDVARDLGSLAGLLRATNRLAEAEPLMRRALAIDEQSYGTEHPKVATDLNNLARLLQATNRFAEAEPLMRRALVIFIMFQLQTGHQHPHQDAAIENYKQLLSDMGLDPEAIEAKLDSVNEEARRAVAPSARAESGPV